MLTRLIFTTLNRGNGDAVDIRFSDIMNQSIRKGINLLNVSDSTLRWVQGPTAFIQTVVFLVCCTALYISCPMIL